MDISVKDRGVYGFGPFVLDPVRRRLTRDGEPVKMAARLFDTLLYLVEHQGRLVDKDELLAAVWGGRVVEEGNLTQTISALRRVLQTDGADSGYIVTAPGRGYRFAAPVDRRDGTVVPAVFAAMSQAMPALMPNGAPATVAPRTRRLGWRIWTPAALALAVAAVAIALPSFRTLQPGKQAATVPPPHSVAVLAFSNLSGDASQDYFSDGLADELINTLSRINDVQVAARTSAFSYKASRATVAQIAHALNVAAILEGSVRREGGHVRINLQLINAATEKAFWSASYDDDLGGIMALQARIARAVASSLQAKLLGTESERLAMGGTTNPAALDAYLRGLSLYEDDKAEPALAAFDQAVALDPAFALAHAHRSKALRYVVFAAQDNPDPAWEARLENDAVVAAQRAVALAPELASGYRALGEALEEGRYDFKGAAAAFERARTLAPGDVQTMHNAAMWLVRTGHPDEALQTVEQTLSLDPLSPGRYQDVAAVQLFTRHYAEAVASFRHAIQVRGYATDSDMAGIGEAEYLLGNPQAALRACGGGKSWYQVFVEALAYHALGRTAEASSALDRLHKELGDTGSAQYADIHAQWGQIDEALRWLDIAYRTHDTGLVDMEVAPEMAPLRQTPGYKAILARMDFPH